MSPPALDVDVLVITFTDWGDISVFQKLRVPAADAYADEKVCLLSFFVGNL